MSKERKWTPIGGEFLRLAYSVEFSLQNSADAKVREAGEVLAREMAWLAGDMVGFKDYEVDLPVSPTERVWEVIEQLAAVVAGERESVDFPYRYTNRGSGSLYIGWLRFLRDPATGRWRAERKTGKA